MVLAVRLAISVSVFIAPIFDNCPVASYPLAKEITTGVGVPSIDTFSPSSGSVMNVGSPEVSFEERTVWVITPPEADMPVIVPVSVGLERVAPVIVGLDMVAPEASMEPVKVGEDSVDALIVPLVIVGDSIVAPEASIVPVNVGEVSVSVPVSVGVSMVMLTADPPVIVGDTIVAPLAVIVAVMVTPEIVPPDNVPVSVGELSVLLVSV